MNMNIKENMHRSEQKSSQVNVMEDCSTTMFLSVDLTV